MDMKTNSHCYSRKRLVFNHFDLLELLRMHNARKGQTRQAATGVIFLPFNDGKVILDGRRIRERYRQSTAQVTQLHEAPFKQSHASLKNVFSSCLSRAAFTSGSCA